MKVKERELKREIVEVGIRLGVLVHAMNSDPAQIQEEIVTLQNHLSVLSHKVQNIQPSIAEDAKKEQTNMKILGAAAGKEGRLKKTQRKERKGKGKPLALRSETNQFQPKQSQTIKAEPTMDDEPMKDVKQEPVEQGFGQSFTQWKAARDSSKGKGRDEELPPQHPFQTKYPDYQSINELISEYGT